jgi:hypothetical protein
MKKKAGSFFKNMKNLFNKKEEQQTSGSQGGANNADFDSEEDNDIIEVGGKTGSGGARLQQMPANSLIGGNHSSGGSGLNSSLNVSLSSGAPTDIPTITHPVPGSFGSTKHLLMEFANNTLLAADNLIHGTD